MPLLRRNAPQFFVFFFLVAMAVATLFVGDMPLAGLVGDALVRLFMNGVMVLSLVPMLSAGVGINYGLPIGLLAGLLGMCVAVNYRLGGIAGFAGAILVAVLIGLIFGYAYARVSRRVKGHEEITGLFVGCSAVFIMCFFWNVAPFTNPEMLWIIGGGGLRPTIGLESTFGKVLNDLGTFNVGGIQIPLAGLSFFGALCLLLSLYLHTRSGRAMAAVGESETFALFSGINVGKYRTIAVVQSTVIAAVGICVYAQSYGFIELYNAPLMMAFPAASAILLGGSTGKRASVIHVLVGTSLFQTAYVFSGPLANSLLVPELSEILRVIISSSIILYALIYAGEGKSA